MSNRETHKANPAYPGQPSACKAGSIMITCLFSFLICCCAISADAQEPYAPAMDPGETSVFMPSPARAAMLSATLPGLGQIYNRKYWKVPVIYTGFGVLIYFVDFNTTHYNKWRKAWLARVDGNPNTVDDFPLHSTDMLERAMNYYRRNLEITYLLSAALYLINILDASVDAHLMNFDVGESLSLGVQPTMVPTMAHEPMPMHGPRISITVKF